MARSPAVLAVAAALLLGIPAPATAFETETTWTDARSTFYGTDAWSIHTGSCGFGFICPNRWAGQLKQGMDITAVSDQSDLYGHCGECLEVKCRNSDIPTKDGSLERTGLCLNDKSVKVKITDTCPCNYPNNAESNERWCCGDFPHLDMSLWALAKITKDTTRWGVFGISYRRVSCDLDLGSDEAPAIASIEDPHKGLQPASLDCAAPAVAETAVSNGELSTESSSAQRATVQQEQLPRVDSSADGYWATWWDQTFPKFSEDTKKRIYKLIWDRIRAGELTREGHGLPDRKLRKLLRA